MDGTASVEVRARRVDSGERLLSNGSIFWYDEGALRSGDVDREFSREWTGDSRIDGRNEAVRVVAIAKDRSSLQIWIGLHRDELRYSTENSNGRLNDGASGDGGG